MPRPTTSGIDSAAKKHFKHLRLVRDDVREELDLLGLSEPASRICDFGCGSGLTTYGLALEIDGSRCIGIDKFDGESSPTLNTLQLYEESVRRYCDHHSYPKKAFPDELCRLIGERRLPVFRRGDIILGKNLPQEVDLAYCKRVLVNILYGKQGNHLSGKDRLLLAINHIASSVRPKGLICVIEYDGLAFEKYFLRSNLQIINRAVFERKDIRSRGRTTVTSRYGIYLCKKPE